MGRTALNFAVKCVSWGKGIVGRGVCVWMCLYECDCVWVCGCNCVGEDEYVWVG